MLTEAGKLDYYNSFYLRASSIVCGRLVTSTLLTYTEEAVY